MNKSNREKNESWANMFISREHCSQEIKLIRKKKERTNQNRRKAKNRTSSHNIFKFKMTEEIKKYKSIYYSHFEGQTD